MNRLPLIKNYGPFSFVIDLFSWSLPLSVDRYPGCYGWTYRVTILCFNFHCRTFRRWTETYYNYDDLDYKYPNGDYDDD